MNAHATRNAVMRRAALYLLLLVVALVVGVKVRNALDMLEEAR